MQAWKVLIPATQTTPEPHTHDGYKWLYGLSGKLRLILGAHDLVLSAGEVAEFHRRLPLWFGSADSNAADVLSLFGRQGDGVHVRAKSEPQRSDEKSEQASA